MIPWESQNQLLKIILVRLRNEGYYVFYSLILIRSYGIFSKLLLINIIKRGSIWKYLLPFLLSFLLLFVSFILSVLSMCVIIWEPLVFALFLPIIIFLYILVMMACFHSCVAKASLTQDHEHSNINTQVLQLEQKLMLKAYLHFFNSTIYLNFCYFITKSSNCHQLVTS